MKNHHAPVSRSGTIISYILQIVLVILLIISIVERDWIYIFACSISIMISFIPAILKRDYHITLPWVFELLIATALFLHVGGGVFKAYHLIPGYDILTHFVSALVVSFLAFSIIYILDEYWEGLCMDTYAMAFVVVIFTMAMGVVWEFLEWTVDMVFGTTEQLGLQDTMQDLLVDTLGGIIMAVVGVKLIKSGKFKQLLKDTGKQVYGSLIRRDSS